MQRYEYKVVPAPKQGKKGKGVKGAKGRFAHALESVMNPLGAEGWEYVRTDTLPFEERQGLTGRTTSYQNLLVFRRPLADLQDTVADTQVAGLLAAPTASQSTRPRSAQSAAAGAVAALAAYRSGRDVGDLAAE